MGEEGTTENGTRARVVLDVEVANGIKHTVATLDESRSGKVSKSQLQAVVANVCQAIKVTFASDDLDQHIPEKEELSVAEFLDFLENKLLLKGKKLNPKEMDELSWLVVGQNYENNPHILTKKDAFKLWLVFKKLDVDGELKVDVEEICIVLEKFVRGIGVQWNEQNLTEFAQDGSLTFWKFIDCLEKKFLIGVDKSVMREGLQELYDLILEEVIRTGFLYKKGHSMLKTQKSRWFVLKPEKLTYYVSSGYREKKGDIILNQDSKVTSVPDKGSNKCKFIVICGLSKKEYEQTAPDQRTRQAWITDIQTAIDCFGGLTPLRRDLIARKAKRDEVKARKAEEEKRRREQEDLLDQQRREIDLLKKKKAEIEKHADEEKAMLDAEIKRREELEELQRNLQQLLEDQKRAREEDERIRAAKERLLEEERKKREELEALRLQQQQELQNEKMQREELMEKQKEQERILEEERKRLQHLEDERIKAEEAAKAASDKLLAAETAAKNAAEQAKDRVRQLKTSIGLKGTVGPKVDPLVTHRGKGAFTLEEFLNRATEWSGLTLEDEERLKATPSNSKAANTDELVKAAATPAPNQNIPEFLRKAAAWSGLNPETYLEGGDEAETKKSPPKVAAKPAKPLPVDGKLEAEINVNGPSVDAEQPQESKPELTVEEKTEGNVVGEDVGGSDKVEDEESSLAKDEVPAVVVEDRDEPRGDGESDGGSIGVNTAGDGNTVTVGSDVPGEKELEEHVSQAAADELPEKQEDKEGSEVEGSHEKDEVAVGVLKNGDISRGNDESDGGSTGVNTASDGNTGTVSSGVPDEKELEGHVSEAAADGLPEKQEDKEGSEVIIGDDAVKGSHAKDEVAVGVLKNGDTSRKDDESDVGSTEVNTTGDGNTGTVSSDVPDEKELEGHVSQAAADELQEKQEDKEGSEVIVGDDAKVAKVDAVGNGLEVERANNGEETEGKDVNDGRPENAAGEETSVAVEKGKCEVVGVDEEESKEVNKDDSVSEEKGTEHERSKPLEEECKEGLDEKSNVVEPNDMKSEENNQNDEVKEEKDSIVKNPSEVVPPEDTNTGANNPGKEDTNTGANEPGNEEPKEASDDSNEHKVNAEESKSPDVGVEAAKAEDNQTKNEEPSSTGVRENDPSDVTEKNENLESKEDSVEPSLDNKDIVENGLSSEEPETTADEGKNSKESETELADKISKVSEDANVQGVKEVDDVE